MFDSPLIVYYYANDVSKILPLPVETEIVARARIEKSETGSRDRFHSLHYKIFFITDNHVNSSSSWKTYLPRGRKLRHVWWKHMKSNKLSTTYYFLIMAARGYPRGVTSTVCNWNRGIWLVQSAVTSAVCKNTAKLIGRSNSGSGIEHTVFIYFDGR